MSSDEQTSKATGTIFKRKGRPVGVRVSMPDGSRPLISFTPEERELVEAMTAEQQKRFARLVSDRQREGARVAADSPETVNEYAKRWLEWREKTVSSAAENKRQLRTMRDVIGTCPIATVTADDMKRVVRALDDASAARTISPKTAINCWATVKAMFRDAAGGTKEERLVVAGLTNVTDGVLAPEKGDDKDRLYLYPEDVIELLSSEAVPLERRRLYAVAIYTAMRAGELHVLDWPDVDFVAGQIRVNKAEDRVRHPGKTKTTKTRKPRRVPIERELLPLLEAMHEEAGGKGRVFPSGVNKRAAEVLHRDLERAGVAKRRPELVQASETVDNLSFHDLRGTAATWWLLRGDSPRNVKKRTGHSGYAMLDRYDHEADDRNVGQLFPPLTMLLLKTPPSTPCVPGTSGGRSPTERMASDPRATSSSATAGIPGDSWGFVADSNPVAPTEIIEESGDSDWHVPVFVPVGGGPSPVDVEAALAVAIAEATKAAQWGVVAALARELEARRLAAAPNVVSLEGRRARK